MDEDINHFLSTLPATLTDALKYSTFQFQQRSKHPSEEEYNHNKLLLLKNLQEKSFKALEEEIKPLIFFENLIQPWLKKAQHKEIALFIYYDPNLPESIKSYKHVLSFILNELISNAIKFTPKDGSIHLHVKQSFKEDKEHLIFTVTDSGIGITQAQESKLFKSYLGKRSTGPSLGLASCYFLLQTLGLKLNISSEYSKGSSFSFYFPMWDIQKAPLLPKKSLTIGILQEDSSMDAYKQQLFSYLLALGSKIITINNSKDARLKQCHALFIVSKTFSPVQKATLAKTYPDCIVIPAYLEKYHKNFSLFQKDKSYKIFFPLLPSSVLDCFRYISSEIALLTIKKQASENDKPATDETKQAESESDETLKILLVEDNAINIKWTLMLLGRYNYQLSYAENGALAVTMVKQKKFDLILMDIDMPVMNGIEATQKIKAYEKEQGLEHTPIVALTSHDQKGEREDILAQGLDEHLGKPLKLTELELLLKKYHEKKHGLKL